MASGWNLWVWLECIGVVIIIITFPYSSTCISSFFASSIPIYLFIFKLFFRSCICYFCEIYSKLCSKNIRDRSKIGSTNNIIINYIGHIIKNVERMLTARARIPRLPHARYQ